MRIRPIVRRAAVSRRAALLDVHDLAGAAPEALEVVVGALFGGEDVHDRAAEVVEPPAVLVAALPARAGAAVRARDGVHGLDQRAHLPLAPGGGDDEVVGEGRERTEVQQHDVRRLVVHQRVDDRAREFRAVQQRFLRPAPRGGAQEYRAYNGAVSAPRVLAAMSGGVDSAVAAAILHRRGYDVVGVTLRLYTEPDGSGPRSRRACCGVEDVADARAAAQRIGIPHYVLNMEREFERDVIEVFASAYANGRTPNPCLECNDRVKFRTLLDRAGALGIGLLATGHYARIRGGEADGGWRLHAAADADKDQSYVLYTLGQEQLARLRFPLGGLTKRETRRIAAGLGLAVADKPDSADICFVPGGDYGQCRLVLDDFAGQVGAGQHGKPPRRMAGQFLGQDFGHPQSGRPFQSFGDA